MNEQHQHSKRSGIVNHFREWFYAKEVPYSLALTRIFVPLAMLFAVIPRWPNVREMYSSDGAPAPFWENYGMTDLLPIFSPEIAMGLYTAMVFLCLAVCVGWKTRLSLVALSALVAYFGLLDALGTLTKYTIFACHTFVLLSFSECGSVWSVDAWIKKRKSGEPVSLEAEIWPQRLIQLLIGFVYLGSAVTKTQTHGFFSGDQMFFWSLTNMNFHNPLGEWMTGFPASLVLFGYFAVIWESLFLFLVWKDPARRILLAFGILFHAMTFFMLGLLVFPLLFFAVYFVFLKESEAKRIGTFFQSLLPKSPQFAERISLAQITSWPAFGAILLGMSLFSIAAERKMDVYSENGPDGRIVLQPLSQEAVAEITQDDRSMAVEDQLFSIDMGTIVVGGYVINPRKTFQTGETVFIQARLIQPHSDVWVEYTLRDSENRVVAREGSIAPREDLRTTFKVPIGQDWPSGEYRLSVTVNTKPSLGRTVHIVNPSR
ncbi:HTTM domain-containing protein [Thalassoglobus polymorphus]|uniref:Vitamin K-dependent gamma-carboxylase n=1 Tax=Thalassoglobus polymorphus TaxID=2527994 RepID=A0A517QTE7_9PLAN|nr:HTTM domain-containing protein [Thalassoglobus polymorphus]QDT34916.1 Vitamin K-dependent gamma-carboxylase [Thalassoglobus polymorphus]